MGHLSEGTISWLAPLQTLRVLNIAIVAYLECRDNIALNSVTGRLINVGPAKIPNKGFQGHGPADDSRVVSH